MFKDSEISRAYLGFMDAICSWERATGREITVLVIPHTADEPIAVSTSGKPWGRRLTLSDILQALGFALQERKEAP